MKKRVLLVDDDSVVVRMVSRTLGQEFEVESYRHGDRALEAIRHHAFDAVVSDMDIGSMMGTDFYREAVKIRPELATRFVFHTGSSDPPKTHVPLIAKSTNATALRDKVRSLVS